MAKIIIALALFVALVAGQFGIGGVCRPQGCVATGAVCDTTNNVNLTATTRERWCKAGDFCKYDGRNITGICVDRADVGEACNEDDGSKYCEGGLQCINKFCNRGYLPGAKCKVANDCLYYAENGDRTAVCNNGRCAGIAAGAKCASSQSCLPPNVCGTDGTCVAAVAAGSTCRSDSHCQIGTYCKAGTCTARIGAGGSCDVSERDDDDDFADQQCILKYACVANAQSGAGALNGTCKELFTAASGSVCMGITDCAGGLACLPPPQGSTYGACGPTVTSSRKSCNATLGADNSVVCSANEVCSCNTNSGAGTCFSSTAEVANKGGKKALSSAADCIAKCARTDYNCLEGCGSKVCSYRNKRETFTVKVTDFLTKCRYDDDVKDQVLPGYIMCSSGSLVQFSVIGLVAFVAALLF